MLLPIPGKYGNRFSLSNTSKSLPKEFTLISLPNGTKYKVLHHDTNGILAGTKNFDNIS